jgi:hypothetical protein
MGDLTRYGSGDTAVVEAIFNQAPLDVTRPGPLLASALFKGNFIPYAKAHWAFDGSQCNCDDLASALLDAWVYLKSVKRPRNLPELPPGEKVACLAGGGMVTRVLPFFSGPTQGNVRQARDGQLDGRCLLARHWVLKVGLVHFDAAFNRSANDPAEIVERQITKLAPALWLSKDKHWLYLRNPNAAPQFSETWDERPARGWLLPPDWAAKTANATATRSPELQQVDAALQLVAREGAPGFEPLKHAFAHWYSNHHEDARVRDQDHCVTGLAMFLGVPARR